MKWVFSYSNPFTLKKVPKKTAKRLLNFSENALKTSKIHRFLGRSLVYGQKSPVLIKSTCALHENPTFQSRKMAKITEKSVVFDLNENSRHRLIVRKSVN